MERASPCPPEHAYLEAVHPGTRYHYTSLPTDDAIRILLLQPSKDNDPVIRASIELAAWATDDGCACLLQTLEIEFTSRPSRRICTMDFARYGALMRFRDCGSMQYASTKTTMRSGAGRWR
ncbi:hypothetical protein CLAFUW4_08672 [Fulvia fulva]|uniref:Uncharacterized protein n=1 Tax=Passalora fulva TaxID=5499 RepID=A0A9Q8LCW8_PASFU|nr:uncharacterized protein CLAFUR5_08770 [Fulvia fulva]KAK4629626.1 hypothetical protein CLAFUR4_08674 [Fulvia fulva]KAK4630596.1 hypothetical protein CLAFUR0_08670 [Fulvia fulva]UJO15093.1 hypothetical protein CLAFUR5_08770 [Fulvia fulva]WPV12590.1 hypothetical protein CLAFUW4_08672 [Fulvia fulva]WPV27454.1 hypothetical protein CLAFUW7_08669 [Fulvia fulva]